MLLKIKEMELCSLYIEDRNNKIDKLENEKNACLLVETGS